MSLPTKFPAVPKGLMLIPYVTSVGDLPVELYGTFCPFSEEFEAQAIAINVKGELIDLTANLSQRLLDNFNRDMRIAGTGKDYARELHEARREEAYERRRDEHEYAGV
ncbi:hypothetical protein [Herbaspirillum huttiense]|uniref:hypothetical protein n=1 Tax=Herbaspirillum huttiense TaxID=863372 RepID=UPI002E77490C|nr:hypothetical protein [Herbaspirillum huttiense]MEE1636382.1 hypothetical protein [Herbaspirillum huttiense NC40101]